MIVRFRFGKTDKELRQEQRYAICAGFHNCYLPNDLTRWISAYAIPNSLIYDYMRT